MGKKPGSIYRVTFMHTPSVRLFTRLDINIYIYTLFKPAGVSCSSRSLSYGLLLKDSGL